MLDFFDNYQATMIDLKTINIIFNEIIYNVTMENNYFIITNDDGHKLNFKFVDACFPFITIKKCISTFELLTDILKTVNVLYAYSTENINDSMISYNGTWVLLNDNSDLFSFFYEIFSLDYNINLGILNDFATSKLYSISFIWLRTVSFTEKCFSIMGRYTSISKYI